MNKRLWVWIDDLAFARDLVAISFIFSATFPGPEQIESENINPRLGSLGSRLLLKRLLIHACWDPRHPHRKS